MQENIFKPFAKSFVIVKVRTYAKTRSLGGIFAKGFDDLKIVDKLADIAYKGFRKLGARHEEIITVTDPELKDLIKMNVCYN